MMQASPASADGFYFNPIDTSFRDNPYPHYPALLLGSPRKFTTFLTATLVARYHDCTAVLRDYEHFSSTPLPALQQIRTNLGPFAGATTMLDSDPPVHTRLRRLVSRAFTSRRVQAMEPRIRQITNQLLDRVGSASNFDLMNDFANLLPVIVIAEMLGVPPEDHEQFKEWSNGIIEGDRMAPGSAPPRDTIRNSSRELCAYLGEQIERRRREPGEDLISALVQAHDDVGALAADELLAFVGLLLLAGNETTASLIGNGMLALARNPDQLARLRGDSALMPSAIEEMLRYDSPVQSFVRTCLSAANVGGTEVVPGELVFVIIAAANRDPGTFANPDTFDIARSPNHHLSFGEGIHFCIGAPLARLMSSIAIGSILERYSELRLADPDAPMVYHGSYILRALKTLPIAITPARHP
ncbi:MAG: cytochrome P450 [Acidobacteriaceae bacterium]